MKLSSHQAYLGFVVCSQIFSGCWLLDPMTLMHCTSSKGVGSRAKTVNLFAYLDLFERLVIFDTQNTDFALCFGLLKPGISHLQGFSVEGRLEGTHSISLLNLFSLFYALLLCLLVESSKAVFLLAISEITVCVSVDGRGKLRYLAFLGVRMWVLKGSPRDTPWWKCFRYFPWFLIDFRFEGQLLFLFLNHFLHRFGFPLVSLLLLSIHPVVQIP